MEQTAVSLAINKIKELQCNENIGDFTKRAYAICMDVLEDFKDIERQQLIDCGNSCALMQHIHIDKINKMTESEIRKFAEEEHLTFGEQYYNEKF